DGGLYFWEIPLLQNPVFESFTKNGQRYGKGYITLTAGTKIEFEFYLVPDTEWERAKQMDATAPKSPPEINQAGVMF
ncbi:MAG TPA: hypothetical protein VNT26_02380, partial [Candidatus Sulfotelmatobacter sp.]|nr:hypothetical protein [Candidatus Sulfotelmatobacter sp.]